MTGLRCVAAGLAAACLALSACAAPHHSSGATAPPSLVARAPIPLPTSLSTVRGSWAVLPLGETGQQLNTFWQLLYLAPGAAQWVERTPPDVAANGGLVMAATATGLDIAFRPSNLLHVSPLALTGDGGATYTTGLVPAEIADVPDALSVSVGGGAAALTGDAVLTGNPSAVSWTSTLTTANVAGSTAGRACAAGPIQAVSLNGSATYVGTSCSTAGVAGVFRSDGGGVVTSAGLVLPAALASADVQVVRLVAYEDGVEALLRLVDGSVTRYLAAWNPTSQAGGWVLSAALTLPGGLVSTAITSPGGFAVLSGSSSALHVALVSPGHPDWTTLPQPPTGTATLAVAGSRIDALVAGVTDFSVYKLSTGGWARTQVTHVDVPFGSSG